MTCPRWNKPAKEGPSRIRHLIRRMDKSLNTAMRAILPRQAPGGGHTASFAPAPGVSNALRSPSQVLDEARTACGANEAIRAPVINRAIKLKYQRPRQPSGPDCVALTSCSQGAPGQTFSHVGSPATSVDLANCAERRIGGKLRRVAPISCSTDSNRLLGRILSRRSRGYGYAVHQDGLTVLSGERLLEGLRAALSLPAADQIVVCLDNLAKEFLEFQALAAEHGATEIRWIPGHTNIPGNEQADALAKAGTSQPEPADALPTLAYLRKVARQRPKDAFKAWWEVSAPQQYRVLDLDATTGCPPELTIPRPLLHHLLAARTHHGDFADYHERTKASLLLPEDRAATSDEVGTSPSAAVNRAIGRDFDQFVKVAKASSFFGTICPRH
ncbi:RNase H domain-containing protein [Hirsutella rhossiliensis]|uniref:RNase H domain-containing protein n=1 Tax=Hirsutella rhossiliensis TaxID=111463 RepID=A0A9P8MWV6_9HYPO|nr:RNase H domain-containing protein [Hirsutella rhossiliensis]KAH0961706.1 RNase H domain-containing protein [Hirsutella rhossiliensis]